MSTKRKTGSPAGQSAAPVKGSKIRRTRKKTGKTTREEETEDAGPAGGATVATVEENQIEDGTAIETKPADKAGLKPKGKSETALEKFAADITAKKIEGLRAEFASLATYVPTDPAATVFSQHKDKNRYNNIPCLDRTRVVLKYQVPPETDYIHANWTMIPESLVKLGNKYICCQAPTEATLNDWWRMIWQEKPKHIIMLCRVVENGKPKCAQYWPLNVGDSKTYATVTVQHVRACTPEKEKVFESSLLNVSVGAESFQLQQHRWLDWPDFGVPNSGMGVLRLLRLVRDSKDCTSLIHCSAGVGRTGTVMAVEIVLRCLIDGKDISALEILKELRNSRAASMQTEGQYLFLHRTLIEYIHAKKLAKNEAAEFSAAYVEYMKTEAAHRKQALPPVPSSPGP
uniref:Tyrosine-protein phosphatase domain-containing protein n=1 Tax=Panagrellus redivivus TaxID=6233 RepID=A0A7E4VL49_PANRE